MGMQLTHRGLMKDGKLISSEKGILKALELDFVEPEERG